MNKQKGKNSIGWCEYTSNPIKGLCPVGCPYCYARGFYRRLHWNPKIRLDRKELFAPSKEKKSLRIFIGSTIEMYHPEIPHEWVSEIIAKSYDTPWHTYLTLTKMPENLKGIEFPEWWWVGVSITGKEKNQVERVLSLSESESSHRFISFEPLLGIIDRTVLELIIAGIVNWVIIGAQTNPYKPPLRKQVDRVLACCKEDTISEATPIFLKDNLSPIMGDLIQEFPK